MHVFERRRERLRELLSTMTAVELATRSGVAPTTISRYLSKPGTKGFKNMSEENARKIEEGTGKPEGWMDQHAAGAPHLDGGVAILTVARQVNQPFRMMDPTSIAWESVVSPLPKLFKVTLPDDSMAPEYRKGSDVVFSTSEGEPRADDAVLVADADDNPFFRVYQPRRPGHWQAVALNPSFQALDSSGDGLRVLAICVGKWGRRG